MQTSIRDVRVGSYLIKSVLPSLLTNENLCGTLKRRHLLIQSLLMLELRVLLLLASYWSKMTPILGMMQPKVRRLFHIALFGTHGSFFGNHLLKQLQTEKIKVVENTAYVFDYFVCS